MTNGPLRETVRIHMLTRIPRSSVTLSKDFNGRSLLTCGFPMYMLLVRSQSRVAKFLMIFVQTHGGSYDMGE